ncbi:hypothetical protein ACN2C7_02170 [Caulobacter sp. ErkDOM-E]|uniref:hypothetical protein n=1 Tax=Caulobacter sp. ErkDOM-E TaxID=3402778 RepID=UPI003AF6CCA1
MSPKKTGSKGLQTEELLRRYFLRAGFFVVRGVPIRHEGVDLTDADLWVYERSATLARRRTIVDIKDKGTPKAAERLFFVKGLAETIGVEGAGVATTDPRPGLRRLARKQGVLWIDGGDIQRLKGSAELANWDRLDEEELASDVATLDTARATRILRDQFSQLKSSIADRFGASSANVSLESAGIFAREVTSAHPSSDSAKTLLRLTYLSTAIAAASLDFASADTALRPAAERLKGLTDAIRYGSDTDGTLEKVRFAESAIREYAPNGAGLAKVVRDGITKDLAAIPAEGLAEIVLKMTRGDTLFEVARLLESAAFSRTVPSFDELETLPRSFVGAVLDFVRIDRPTFAKSVRSSSLVPAQISGMHEGTQQASQSLVPDDIHTTTKPGQLI